MLSMCQTDRYGQTVQSQIRLKEQCPAERGQGGGQLLVNLVPMLEQKNGYFLLGTQWKGYLFLII